MGDGPFSSSSASEQTTTTAQDQGQVSQKSTIAQGQSVLLYGKQALLGTKYGDVKAEKGSTVTLTYGDGGQATVDLANQFLSTINTLNQGQVTSTKALTDKLASLLENQQTAQQTANDAADSSGLTTIQKTLFGLAGIGLAYIVFWPKKKP